MKHLMQLRVFLLSKGDEIDCRNDANCCIEM